LLFVYALFRPGAENSGHFVEVSWTNMVAGAFDWNKSQSRRFDVRYLPVSFVNNYD